MTLNSESPWSKVVYYNDALPSNLLSLEAEQLLAGISVLDELSIDFKPFSGDKKYRQLSEELLNLKFEGTSVAVNSIALDAISKK
jgi:hypothetical protein